MRKNYSLIDTGNGRKLERFGNIIVNRIAKQATWNPGYKEEVWDKADLVFENGVWRGNLREREFRAEFEDIIFDLKPMERGQIGIFTEQEESWAWLLETINGLGGKLKILNGFAYTGGATLFCSTPTTELCHIDASKTFIKYARRNAGLSSRESNGIRWIPDDVLAFMEKEVKRGKRYNGFIFDPPGFGRGPKGKIWKLGKDIPKLIGLIGQLAEGTPDFVLISAHDPGFPQDRIAQLMGTIKGILKEDVVTGSLVIKAESKKNLHSGYYARWRGYTHSDLVSGFPSPLASRCTTPPR